MNRHCYPTLLIYLFHRPCATNRSLDLYLLSNVMKHVGAVINHKYGLILQVNFRSRQQCRISSSALTKRPANCRSCHVNQLSVPDWRKEAKQQVHHNEQFFASLCKNPREEQKPYRAKPRFTLISYLTLPRGSIVAENRCFVLFYFRSNYLNII